MNLELVIAPSGYGKTEYILKDIEKNRYNKKIIVITPNQNGYNYEKSLCDRLGATFNIDVMNFSSLTKFLEKKLQLEKENLISDDLKMFYYLEVSKKLESKNNYLAKRILEDNEFLLVVSEIIDELEKYNVTVDLLEEYLKNNKEENNFEKIKSIREFYLEYQNYLLFNKREDYTRYSNRIYEDIDYIKLDDYIFYIDGYYNFTKQEFRFLEKIFQNSHKVIFSVISDINRYTNYNFNYIREDNSHFELPSSEDVEKKHKYALDIYRKSHEVLSNIKNILKNNNIDKFSVITFFSEEKNNITYKLNIENNLVSSVEELYSFEENRYLNKDLKHLANEYPKIFKSKKSSSNNFKIIKLSSPEQEVRQVAREIYKLINFEEKNNSIVNQEDIAILYRDEIYEKYINIFSDYGIKIYLDKDNDVTNHRLFRLLNNILNYNDDNFLESIDNLLKSRLINVDKVLNKASKFYEKINNNQAKKLNFVKILKDNNIYSYDDFKNKILSKNIKTDNNTELLISIDFVSYIRDIILKVRESNNVEEFTKKLNYILVEFDVKMYLYEQLEESGQFEELQLESIDRQVYTKLLSLLDNLINTVGHQKLRYEEYKNLLLLALKNIKYRSIPVVNSCVTMSTVDLAKVENKKVVIILGFNNGVFPKKIESNSIIDDSDKEKFINAGIYLSPRTDSLLIDEEFVSYIALTRARENIIITYNIEKDKVESSYYSTLNNIFDNLTIENADNIIECNIELMNKFIDCYRDDKQFNNLLNNIYCKRELNYIITKFKQLYNVLPKDNIEQINKIEKILIAIQNKTIYDYKYKEKSIYEHLDDNNLITEQNYYYKEYKDNLTANSFDENLKIKIIEENEDVFERFSFSKLDLYQKNPYKYFVKNILKIKEEQRYGITPLIKGSFYHAIMSDETIKKLIEKKSVNINSENYDKIISKKVQFIECKEEITEIKKYVYEAIANTKNKDILRYIDLINSKGVYEYTLEKDIERLASCILVEILCSYKSGYKIYDVEKKFEITLYKSDTEQDSKDNINKITLAGVIDRIDSNGEKYLIVDYKSSEKNFEYKEIYNEKISQLLVYLFAIEKICEITEEDIFGVYYRELAKTNGIYDTYRLRGISNEDILLQEEDPKKSKEIMFTRVTTKNAIHGGDIHKVYNSKEFSKLKNLNIKYIFSTVEKIRDFKFFMENSDLETLYNYDEDKELIIEKEITNKDFKEYIKSI